MALTKLMHAIILVALGAVACTSTNDENEREDSSERRVVSGVPPVSSAERQADSIGASGVSMPVADVGRHGEDLYDQVKASDWTRAGRTVDSLRIVVAALQPRERTAIQPALDSLLTAISTRRRDNALLAANRITYVDAALTESYHPATPADIVRLDYYGRELEIWAARGDLGRLATTTEELRAAWERVRATVISKGGATAASRTDSLVTRLGAARTASQYASLATPILDVVDELEKPFEH